MAFGNFKSLQEVAKAYQITLDNDHFIEPIPIPVDPRFQSELSFSLKNVAVRVSEAAISEFMIAPVLREVWRPYCDTLLIWSHVPLGQTGTLQGVPDFFFHQTIAAGIGSGSSSACWLAR